MNVRPDLVRLNLVPGLTPRAALSLRKRFEEPSKALGRSAAELITLPGVGPVLASRLADPPSIGDARREIRKAERLGVTLLDLHSPEYPEPLERIPDPPLVLYILGRGRPQWEGTAVVGARRASVYGRVQAERFGGGLAGAGLVVVSGLARGVDAAAHEGALEVDGTTVAVLGSGVDRIYPPEHKRLAARIRERGFVCSEFPLSTPPLAHHFPLRNRIIAGLSTAVVVIEGRLKSGSLITARTAADYDRLVFAVPGRVDTDLSAGPHSLIREGAILARGPEDVLLDLGYGGGPPEENRPPPADPLQARVLEVLDGSRPRGVEEILEKTGASAPEVLAALLALELSGRIRQLSGRRYVTRSGG